MVDIESLPNCIGFVRLCKFCSLPWREHHGENSELCVCQLKLDYRKRPRKHLSAMTKRRIKLHADAKGLCYYCGIETFFTYKRQDNTATLDHLIPQCKGGTNGLNNLVLSCAKCNNEKGDMTLDEFINKKKNFKSE